MLKPRRRDWTSRTFQRGLSVVEMMVGVAVGLFVVAVATVTVATQLTQNRNLLLDTQLQQDLRATADIITRELRRSGSTVDAQNALAPNAAPNKYSGLTIVDASASSSAVTYKYSQAANNSNTYGFRLTDAGVIEASLSTTTGYQQLTDPATMKVTTFKVTETSSAALPIPCPHLCAGGGTACWPTLQVRQLQVDIAAQAANDPTVTRSVSSTVRVRNDALNFNDAGNPNAFCPS